MCSIDIQMGEIVENDKKESESGDNAQVRQFITLLKLFLYFLTL
jgi:hypothetical protein